MQKQYEASEKIKRPDNGSFFKIKEQPGPEKISRFDIFR